jgi:hypothetical protein
MYLVLGIAAASAAAVLFYNHYRDLRPEMADSSITRAGQLAAVVLVMARAVEGVLDALNAGVTPEPAGAGHGRPLVDIWGEEDYR